MDDFEDKMKERWKERRKKAFNWPKLIIMTLALIVILYLMNHLGETNRIVNPSASTVDTTQTDTTHTGVAP